MDKITPYTKEELEGLDWTFTATSDGIEYVDTTSDQSITGAKTFYNIVKNIGAPFQVSSSDAENASYTRIMHGNISHSDPEGKSPLNIQAQNSPLNLQGANIYVDATTFDMFNGFARFRSVGALTANGIAIGSFTANETEGSIITANKHVVPGGSASQFLKANGSLDNSQYVSIEALQDYVTFGQLQTILEGYIKQGDAAMLDRLTVNRDIIVVDGITNADGLHHYITDETAVVFDGNNNVQLRDGTKILGLTETGPGTGEFISRELIGMNKYEVGQPTQFYASELGNKHVGTTLNTADNIAVDTEHGREYVQYVSNGGRQTIEGNLAATGSTLTVTIEDNIELKATRTDTNTVTITAQRLAGVDISVPITDRQSGASTVLTERNVYVIGEDGPTEIDTLNVGTNKIAEFWLAYIDRRYHITVGADDDDLSIAWVTIDEGFIIQQQV